MIRPERLQYHVVDAADLTPPQHVDINRLIRTSVEFDYPGRSEQEYKYLVEQSARSRRDPNLSVGNAFTKRQSFARSVVVLATNSESELVAQLPVADNASSRPIGNLPDKASDLLGVLIRKAKLHWTEGKIQGKPLIESRWMWLGLCAMSEELRTQTEEQCLEAFTVVDGLITAAGIGRDKRQPVAAYPWRQETAWRVGLLGAGLESTHTPQPPEDGSYVAAFGNGATAVIQERWTAPSISHVQVTIAKKDPIGYAIARKGIQDLPHS